MFDTIPRLRAKRQTPPQRHRASAHYSLLQTHPHRYTYSHALHAKFSHLHPLGPKQPPYIAERPHTSSGSYRRRRAQWWWWWSVSFSWNGPCISSGLPASHWCGVFGMRFMGVCCLLLCVLCFNRAAAGEFTERVRVCQWVTDFMRSSKPRAMSTARVIQYSTQRLVGATTMLCSLEFGSHKKDNA